MQRPAVAGGWSEVLGCVRPELLHMGERTCRRPTQLARAEFNLHPTDGTPNEALDGLDLAWPAKHTRLLIFR